MRRRRAAGQPAGGNDGHWSVHGATCAGREIGEDFGDRGRLWSDALAQPLAPAGEHYFIDFRARPSSYIGHTYIVFGRMNAAGQMVDVRYAGLVPEKDAWKGLIVPIRGTVRRYIDDTRLKPSMIYRRRLTAAEFRHLSRTVDFLHTTEHQWHALFQNCNDFGIQIATALGLWRPPSLMPPDVWVGMLRALNER
jgi:hypothetical protein